MSAPITPVLDLRPDRTKTYQPFKTILDRILVRRIETPSTVDGFEVAEKFRQHTNRGEVVAVGDWVVLGGQCHKVTEFVNIGDIVLYGEYTAERQSKDDETLWIVRLQDVRGVERLV